MTKKKIVRIFILNDETVLYSSGKTKRLNLAKNSIDKNEERIKKRNNKNIRK